MLKSAFLALLLCMAPLARADVSFSSAHALVVDEDSGEVLLEKDADTAAPIASMTKLITAMVVLDAKLPPDEVIRIDRADLDTLKHTFSGVPVGASFPRHTLIEIALMSSDNHAAAALARTYPGGDTAFLDAAQKKIAELGLENTGLVEPTGLSPQNHASAKDMVKILKAATVYPEITQATSQPSSRIVVNGRTRLFRNTNHLVRGGEVDVLGGKTGFISKAGYCLATLLRLPQSTQQVAVVVLGARSNAGRFMETQNLFNWMSNKAASAVFATGTPTPVPAP